MIAVAVLGGIALGAAVLLMLRRERITQLMALGLVAVALTVAFGVVGAPLPALGMLLMGGLSTALLLWPVSSDQPRPATAEGSSQQLITGTVAVEAAVAVASVAVLIVLGISARSDFHHSPAELPSIALVGRHILLGTGVSVLGLLVLTATLMVGMTALVKRDRRELAEDQAEATRRRRAAEQRRRARQREAAREAARQARRRDVR